MADRATANHGRRRAATPTSAGRDTAHTNHVLVFRRRTSPSRITGTRRSLMDAAEPVDQGLLAAALDQLVVHHDVLSQRVSVSSPSGRWRIPIATPRPDDARAADLRPAARPAPQHGAHERTRPRSMPRGTLASISRGRRRSAVALDAAPPCHGVTAQAGRAGQHGLTLHCPPD